MALVDLKINRDFLNSKFEGYKLSLDSIPILKQQINPGVKPFESDVEEYSYLQVHMSSHFNQLFKDPWNPTCMFFVNQKKFICWCSLMQDGRLSNIREVFELPQENSSAKGNVCISFPTNEWSVVSTGCGTVYLLHTPSRPVGEAWMLCHSFSVPDCCSSCYLLDTTYLSLPSWQQIDILLAHFCRTKRGEEKCPPFSTQLEWLTFTCGHDIQDWRLKRTRRLNGLSAILYVALEKSCDAVYIASETEFKFIFDSEIPVLQEDLSTSEMVEEDPLYHYIQTSEDIAIIFRPEKATKEDIQVLFEPRHLEVLWRGTAVLKGQFEHSIDTVCSTWIFSDNKLEITVCKTEPGLMWKTLLKDDKRGKELMDPVLAEEIHNQLAHLTSESEVTPSPSMPFNMDQLEECDSSADVMSLIRIDGNTHCKTHQVHMGGHQWLFSSYFNPKVLPAICLRHDVDGIIWQPRNTSCEGDSDQFKIDHIATFSALGYVQASKQDKKFTSCTPDFRHAVISDCSRHLYVYCQPESLHSSLELRNRRTGELISDVAKLYVINLENCQEILGMHLSIDSIFVLSKNMLYVVKLDSK